MILISILEVILLIFPTLLAVAYITVAERKTMASMQRRLGPNVVGYYGLLQAFADALKLLIKEYIAPAQSNLLLFFLGPIITLFFMLVGYGVIPFGPFSWITDSNLGVLYILAVSSLSTYGILLAGWSANSKFAFLGSIRSTAQLISYELVLSSVIILVIMITSSLNLNVNVQCQKSVWFILPLLPIFLIFFIGSIAETNRAPFDLAEAESELVSGFMTEHSSVIFVFFFLAEYGSMLLMCILTSIFFMGGYLEFYDYTYIIDYINCFFYSYDINCFYNLYGEIVNENLVTLKGGKFIVNPSKNIISIIFYAFNLGLKSSILIFVFIWVRASFPRIRFDQLMAFCWTVLLPILFGFILLIPCLIYCFDLFFLGINLF